MSVHLDMLSLAVELFEVTALNYAEMPVGCKRATAREIYLLALDFLPA